MFDRVLYTCLPDFSFNVGAVYTYTGQYAIAFFMCGGMAFSSAILLFAVTCVRDEEQVVMRKEKRERLIEEKKKKKEQREKEKGMTTLISRRFLNFH